MRPLLFALVLLAVTGCRDAIVTDPLVPPTGPPAAEQGSLYLKGVGETLVLGAQTTLRCQSHPDAARYVWDFTGDGEVAPVSTTGARTLTVAGYRVGPVDVRVLAYGADGALVGRASRSFEVAR
jgi:hypothetical protein